MGCTAAAHWENAALSASRGAASLPAALPAILPACESVASSSSGPNAMSTSASAKTLKRSRAWRHAPRWRSLKDVTSPPKTPQNRFVQRPLAAVGSRARRPPAPRTCGKALPGRGVSWRAR
eukprot:8358745-Lingulodinium_polyedra.AAC.4